MLELWREWWQYSIYFGGVAWVLWVALLVPAVSYKIATSNKYKLGRFERVLARLPVFPRRRGSAALPQIDGVGKHWDELDCRLGTQASRLRRAQQALLSPAFAVAVLIFLLGIVQMFLALVGFIGQVVSWQYLGFAAMFLFLIPGALTFQMGDVRWRNRTSVKTQFLEKTRWIVFWLHSDRDRHPERLTGGDASKRLDEVERLLRTRYRRPNIDTPLGEKAQAAEWMENIVPLLQDKVKINALKDADAVVSATTAWIDKAARLLDQNNSPRSWFWKRLSLRKLSNAELADLYRTRRYQPMMQWIPWILFAGSLAMVAFFYFLRAVEQPADQSGIASFLTLLPGLVSIAIPIVGAVMTVRRELRTGGPINLR